MQHTFRQKQFFGYLIELGSGSGMDGLLLNESNNPCSIDFYLENSTCLTLCEEWKQFSDDATDLIIAFTTIGSVIGILGSIAFIVAYFVRHKSM